LLGWADEQNRGTTRLFEAVSPQLRAINTESDGFIDTVRLTVGFRLPPHLSPEEVTTVARALAAPEAQLYAYSTAAAYQGDKNNPLVRGTLAAIRANGARPGFVLKGGTSDMNVVGARWTCPIIAYGPGDSHLDHTPDEHLSLPEYAQAVYTLRHLIAHLATTTAAAPTRAASKVRTP